MAIYHLTTRGGLAHQGRALSHAEYISREGKYSDRNDLVYSETGNMPAWAQDTPPDFWRACDKLERSNGRAYREFEMALPREINHEQHRALVRQFASEQLGDKHVYEWAIHDKGDGNPHAHIMFSERILDGIDRDRDQFFKRANGKNPERGGCLKDARWNVGRGKESEVLQEARGRWADLQNVHLERAGELARVDHRSLEAQGVKRYPQIHVGFQDRARPEVYAERAGRNDTIKEANRIPELIKAEFEAAIHLDAMSYSIQTLQNKINAPNKEKIDNEYKPHLSGEITADMSRHDENIIDRAGVVDRYLKGNSDNQEPKLLTTQEPSRMRELSDEEFSKEWYDSKYKIMKDRRCWVEEEICIIDKQLEEVQGKRKELLESHNNDCPSKPSGLFSVFKKASYEKSIDEWRQKRTAIYNWGHDYESEIYEKRSDLKKKIDDFSLNRYADNVMEKEWPEDAQKIKVYEEQKQQKEVQTNHRRVKKQRALENSSDRGIEL